MALITKFADYNPYATSLLAVSESFDRANKLYFKTDLLDAEQQERVLKVTNRDNFTEYVAKYAVALKHRWDATELLKSFY